MMADKEQGYGYGSDKGGSVVSRGALQLVLLAAAGMFLVPLIWMASTSLKPLDQTMSTPPTWVPRATLAMLQDQRTIVVREGAPLREDHVVVIQRGGHDTGVRKLLPKAKVIGGLAQVSFTLAGREQLEQDPVPVEIVKECPKGWQKIKQWVADYSREKSQSQLAWDCVREDELSAVPHAFWQNYPSALARMQEEGDPTWYRTGFVRYLFNTLWVCGLSVLGVLVSCTLVAYAFAFLEFPGRKWLFALTLAVMMVPFPATMVPLFDVYRALDWTGTFKPLWAPAWFGGAFYIFLLRQFFLGLPRDLLDAARIDGCSELEIVWHVVVPLSKPALAMVALFQFIGSWKDFMGPLLFITDKSQFTLSLGLQAFQSQHGGTPWHLSMAASMMFSMPLIILFLLARKTFMRGIAMTGIKG